MQCLLVHAHPLEKSLSRHFLDQAKTALEGAGHVVDSLDLYQSGFDPRLTAAERTSYNQTNFNRSAIEQEAAQLEQAEILVLVFPTWWFGPPAILKGWIDRVFAPGIAFDHGADFGPIKPRLTGLRHVVVITSLGTPWWVDWFVLRRPVRRMLKLAVFGACAPQAGFEYLPFYAAETADQHRIARFSQRMVHRLATL